MDRRVAARLAMTAAPVTATPTLVVIATPSVVVIATPTFVVIATPTFAVIATPTFVVIASEARQSMNHLQSTDRFVPRDEG